MKFLYKIVLTILFLSSCCYSASTIDTLHYSTTIPIQENDSITIHRGIVSASVSPDGKYMAFVDRSFGYVAIAELGSGKIVNAFMISDSLTKCFIEAAPKKYFPDISDTIYFPEYDTYKDAGVTENLCKNTVDGVYWQDSILYLSATLRAVEIMAKDSSQIITNIGALLKLSYDMKLKNVIVFEVEDKHKSYSLSDFMIPCDSNYIISVSDNQRQHEHHKFDSLAEFSLYDKNGYFVKVLKYLQKDLTDLKIGYSFRVNNYWTKLRNRIYYINYFEYKIRDLFDDSRSILIQGVDTSNYVFWQKYSERVKSLPDTITLNFDDLKKIKKLSPSCANMNLFSIDNKYIGLVLTENLYKFQIYNTEGILMKNMVIQIPEKHSAKFFTYDDKNHCIYGISYFKENYYINKYPIGNIK